MSFKVKFGISLFFDIVVLLIMPVVIALCGHCLLMFSILAVLIGQWLRIFVITIISTSEYQSIAEFLILFDVIILMRHNQIISVFDRYDPLTLQLLPPVLSSGFTRTQSDDNILNCVYDKPSLSSSSHVAAAAAIDRPRFRRPPPPLPPPYDIQVRGILYSQCQLPTKFSKSILL